ncbi:phosphatidylserine/phosphatidylglycerophosphate/cardiolipin synthase family protein [Synechococcus sp. FGCU-3]|nr:phosphatidylserine/phosphatidylglycerophosphate/cardiolipin synthase family protein [Synechococcus sp. FGCU3]
MGPASLLALAIALGSCQGKAGLTGAPPTPGPLPPGITVVFNHNDNQRYKSPINGQWRRGDNLEAFLLKGIGEARREILVAVQELSLPRVAEALAQRHREGLTVRVILENTYSAPWSQEHPADLSPHQRTRHNQLETLGWGDAVAILQRQGVPLIDDTADGSKGSGLMHSKFLVIDRRSVITGSTNFTPSCTHGDPDDPRTRGNVNHLLRFESPALAELFSAEFNRMWGDGPSGAQDSRFGIAKESGPLQVVKVGSTPVAVLFAPHRRRDPNHGLALINTLLAGAKRRVDLALFVLSDQSLANTLGQLHRRGVKIRLLADPGFANRSFSEVLDLLGTSLPDRDCKLEAGNAPLQQAIDGVGTPQLARGDKLHHKLAVIDGERIITGSFNWSPSAAHQNDETLLVIDSPQLARHFTAEIDRLWRGAELGVSARLKRKQARQRALCGSGKTR